MFRQLDFDIERVVGCNVTVLPIQSYSNQLLCHMGNTEIAMQTMGKLCYVTVSKYLYVFSCVKSNLAGGYNKTTNENRVYNKVQMHLFICTCIPI